MKKIDMSSDAITRRLRQTEQLRKLSISLMSATLISDEEAARLRERLRTKKLNSVALAPVLGDSPTQYK